jgi:hypothetical protein
MMPGGTVHQYGACQVVPYAYVERIVVQPAPLGPMRKRAPRAAHGERASSAQRIWNGGVWVLFALAIGSLALAIMCYSL